MQLGIRPQHFNRDQYIRKNEHTGEEELFDPIQIFLSPAIQYSSLDCYASPKVPMPYFLNNVENSYLDL